MLMAAKKKKGNWQKYPSSRAIIPDLRATFITHSMTSCTNNSYIPLDPSRYDWRWDQTELSWQPIWFEGNPLHTEYAELYNTESVAIEVDCIEDFQEIDDYCDVQTDDDSDYDVSDEELSDSDAE